VKTAGTLSGSRGCWPAIAVKPALRSATRRAMTPSTAISWKEILMSCGGITVAAGTASAEGLIDATPQQCAGLRSDPPRSVPTPSGLMPLARAAASPPLDPPAERCGFHGLRVRPCSAESVWTRKAKSGKLVRPNAIAPAARSRSTGGASTGAIASARAGTPCVVGVPATSMFSLTVNGTPCSGPSQVPPAANRSASSAAASACSGRSRTIAFT
jgi:hypothetical protein